MRPSRKTALKETKPTVHTCYICYEDYESQSMLPLSCSHSFCKECLSQLRSPICPMCREPIQKSKFVSQGLINLMTAKSEQDNNQFSEEATREAVEAATEQQSDPGDFRASVGYVFQVLSQEEDEDNIFVRNLPQDSDSDSDEFDAFLRMMNRIAVIARDGRTFRYSPSQGE